MATSLKNTLETILMVVAVTCAVIITVVTVTRRSSDGQSERRPPAQPRTVGDWARYGMVGHRFGAVTAPVTIVEFSDFECPFCQRFATGALRYVMERHPDDVSVVFRHWPLSIHRLAYPAARASECAAAQGKFEAFYDVVFSKQDSLGILSFQDFAARSGVPDGKLFSSCLAIASPVAAIEDDIRAAKELGGAGTPSVLVNSTLLPGTPDSARLDSVVSSALAKAKRP